jgi:hypothetical protein
MAHDQEVVGSNPSTVYWMDLSDNSYYINSYSKITKKNNVSPIKIEIKMFLIRS